MWKCQHCGADVEQDWETCWNCQWQRDGSSPAEPIQVSDLTPETIATDPTNQPSSPICLRCGTVMEFKTIGYINQTITLLETRYAFEVFVCTRCGHLELFDEALRKAKYEV